MSYDNGTTSRVVRKVKVPVYSDTELDSDCSLDSDTELDSDGFSETGTDYSDVGAQAYYPKMRSMSRVETQYCVACGKENPVGEKCSCGYRLNGIWDEISTGLRWGAYISGYSFLGLFFVNIEIKDKPYKFCPYCGACIGRDDMVCANCYEKQPVIGTAVFVTAGLIALVLSVLIGLAGYYM